MLPKNAMPKAKLVFMAKVWHQLTITGTVMVNWCHTFAMKTNLALGMAFFGKIGSFYLKNKSGTAAKRIIVILMVIK